MKYSILKTALLLITFVTIISCSKNEPNIGGTNGPDNQVGTFTGSIQIYDSPQTKLGYIYNAKAIVTRSGNNVTVKITGNEGFDREFTGVVFAADATTLSATMQKQTKPVNKNIGGTTTIVGNDGTFDFNLGTDNITVKENPAATTTINIAGEVRLRGAPLLRQ